MKKNNTTSLIHATLFVSCTAHVALWGSDTTPYNKKSHDGFYPMRTTVTIEKDEPFFDLFSPISGKEKDCLLHERYTNPTTKNPIPGFVSPIASPQTSPVKIAPKEKMRGARGPVNKPGLGRDLFGVQKENNDAQNSDLAPDILAIAQTFNSDMSQEHKIILAKHVTRYASSSSSGTSSYHATKKSSWKDKTTVRSVAGDLKGFIAEVTPIAKKYPRVFGDTVRQWNETFGYLENHMENNCEKSSTGYFLLSADFESPEDIRDKMNDSKARILCSYKCEEELAAQESPRYKSED